MKNTLKWSAAIAAAMLFGCAQPVKQVDNFAGACPEPAPPTMPTTPDRPCNLVHCWINVSVEQEPYPSCKRYVTVEVDKLKMAKKHKAAINWLLVTTGNQYEFRLGGTGNEYTGGSIWFKPPNAESAPSQFTVPKLHGPKQISMDNANTNSITYAYGVRVFDTRSTDHPRPVDPALINDF